MAATAQQINARGANVEENWVAALVAMDPALLHAPTSNTAAVVTVTAAPGRRHVLRQIRGSYSAAPAAGSTLIVEDGSGNTIDKQYLAAGGPFEFNYDPPLAGTTGAALIVTLAAGGSGISGAVQVNAYDEL